MSQDYENPKAAHLLSEIKDIAKRAGSIMLSASVDDKSVMSKDGHANFVTLYDEKVQAFLIAALSDVLPEAHFVGEEDGQEVFLPEFETGYTFVIDPIDGTSNFMKAYRPGVTSIALLQNGKPYLGVIYQPYSEQMFYAQKGAGAFENGKPLLPVETPLKDCLVGMGTSPYYGEEISRSALEIGLWYLNRSIDIRRTGSACYDLCMVASGRTGLFYEPRLCLWDYAAGCCIVEEAGGKVTDMYGNPLTYRGKTSLCAAASGVSKEDYLPPRQMVK